MARSKADEATRQLAWGDLRAFLKVSKERGEVQVIRNVDPHLEMGALYELSLRKKYPPVLLFEDIKGYPKNYRVLTNVRTSRLLVGRSISRQFGTSGGGDSAANKRASHRSSSMMGLCWRTYSETMG